MQKSKQTIKKITNFDIPVKKINKTTIYTYNIGNNHIGKIIERFIENFPAYDKLFFINNR